MAAQGRLPWGLRRRTAARYDINAHSRQHVQTVQLASANQPGRSTLQGNTLSVYAPHVNAATVHQAKPTRVTQTLTHPTFNRGVSITKPMDVTASVKGTAPTPEAIQAAQTAQLHATSKAKIATEKTVPRTTLSQPLTSMEVAKPTHQAPNATGVAGNGTTILKPYTEHAAVKSPYTGGTETPAVNHPAATSPYTGESNASQAELAKQKKLDQQKAIQQQQHTQAQSNQQEQQQQVVHPQQQEQVYHPQQEPVVQHPRPTRNNSSSSYTPATGGAPQQEAQPKAAPQRQSRRKEWKKIRQRDNGRGGPGH